ncbi:lycopene cyclase domain-containing protein [Altibacter sp. HG106]|uniref:lycopene cyclase domain-containing protein n=1 Tax=Altibacter sp. HG106 TaxID=3023937 RepID=UPI002350A331|nr:lycopene cyclase domain-containing protein [Altibacter sp. HG106]MDC7996287.1 lycopene cyclase domain-containing protein [Altibacter sp. HG106]
MQYLYLWLDLGSLAVPLLFSFHPRLAFYKKWRFFFPAVLFMMLIFLPWDIAFTHHGFWGFNEDYLSGIYLLNLPIEEWLFFLCIPYACIFSHYALLTLLPKLVLPKRVTGYIYVVLVSVLIIALWYGYLQWYTSLCFLYALLLLGIVYNTRPRWLSEFFPTYLFILIPFFLVNGLLTGSWIDEMVVWYNNEENFGVRFGTIPVEDTIYNLGMLLTVFAGMSFLEARYERKRS